MAKDYFQDILPPNSDRNQGSNPIPVNKMRDDIAPSAPVPVATVPQPTAPAPTPERSIRNISVPNRSRPMEPREQSTPMPPRARGRAPLLLWGALGVLIILVAGVSVIAMQPTTVTLTARTHPVVFDQTTASYLAYPGEQAATGTLPYTVQQMDLEDSEVVSSTGTAHVEAKASGSITVYNSFSDAPVKLIKNTRFSTSDGLIFRTPADISVPGRKGGTPGTVTVTVVADATGDKYNVAPTKFTIPGLAGNAAMSAGVYAKSSTAFAGGFSGDKPGVSNDAMNAAQSAMRTRVMSQAKTAADKISGGIVLPGLTRITYTDSTPTKETDSTTRLHLKAHIDMVVLPVQAFAAAIAESSGSDTQSVTMHLKPGAGFDASYAASSTPVLGTDPISFVVSGTATVVWDIDTAALTQSLANHDKGAFETIVNGFPAIQEAHARIEPFWSNRFPANPAAIKVQITGSEAHS